MNAGQRNEILGTLINDYDYNPKAILESFIKALPNDQAVELFRDLARLEEWPHRIASNGEVILPSLDGEYESGASDHDTNDFILTAINTKSVHDEIHQGTTARDIASSYKREFMCDFEKINWMEVETAFEHERKSY